jgi:hypothetical protein
MSSLGHHDQAGAGGAATAALRSNEHDDVLDEIERFVAAERVPHPPAWPITSSAAASPKCPEPSTTLERTS